MFGFGEDEEEYQEPKPMPFAPAEEQPVKPAIDVNQYIMDKYNLGGYSDADRQKIVDENKKEESGLNWAAGLSAFGAGLAGRDAGAAGQQMIAQQKAKRAGKLSEFDKSKSLAMDSDKRAKQMDPNSQESKLAQEMALSMGMNPEQASKITAAQFQEFSPALKMKYEIAERAKDRSLDREAKLAQIAAANADRSIRREELKAGKDEKIAEKMEQLKTPYGLANTADDAKQLKEAHESKQNFDSKIGEMIALREKHDGGALFNREDVARGKQLSKDLLLEYKNMAKLGVLSKADEDIINAIIPKDPLEYSAAGLMGQDPILHQLKKFQGDSDKDFATRVQTRTRKGMEDYAKNPPGETKNLPFADANKAMPEKSGFKAATAPKGQILTTPDGRKIMKTATGWVPAPANMTAELPEEE
jgi:hypothetical protein